MCAPGSFQENKARKILCDLKIRMNFLIPTTITELMAIKRKKNCRTMTFAVPSDKRMQKKTFERREKYLVLTREVKKLWNMKGDGHTNCNWHT